MIPLLVWGTVAALSTGLKMYEEISGGSAQEHQIELQRKENELQYNQKALSNYDIMEKVLDKQVAQAAVRGVALDSPSFNALQRGTYNAGAREAQNIETEKSISEINSDIEKRNVKKSLYAQLFGDTANLALQFASLSDSMPTAKG